MAIVSVNGLTAYDAQMFTPRFGAWQIDMRVDDPNALSGRVRVVIDTDVPELGITAGRVLLGTVSRSGAFIDASQVRVVAGGGGLGVSARPQHYESTTLHVVLADLLATANEQISGTADLRVLGIQIGSWTTGARPVGSVIRDLFAVAAPNAAWRMLDDGTMWVGTDEFPASGIDTSTYEVMDRSAEENSIRIATDGPLPLVGKTFEGGEVNCVQDDVPHVGKVGARIWFESKVPKQADRVLAAIQDLVRGTNPGIDHRFRYWADVIAQGGATVDGQPENQGVPDMGGVTLAAQAGDSVDGVKGGRVIVGWAGDASQRYAAGFDGGAMPTTRTLAVLTALNLGGPGAQPTLVGPAFLAALAPVLDALAAYIPVAQSIADPIGTVSAALTSALTAYKAAASATLSLKAKVL
jgi:hypothetical protein